MSLEYGNTESGRNRQGTGFRMLRILTFLGEQEAVGARSDMCLEKLLWILGVQEWMGEHSRRLQEDLRIHMLGMWIKGETWRERC